MSDYEPPLTPGHQEGDPVRIITREQLSEGYRHFRGIGDPGDRCEYQVIRQMDDGTYLVKEPQ